VLQGVTALDTGGFFTCAVLGDGTVRCAGDNVTGQLGDGTMADRAQPVAVLGLTGVTRISAGGQFACALVGDRELRCWGYNASGQLGIGSTDMQRTTPAVVVGLP
jgi:alpha-tubulin suppressor-like RCC1 family protein